jgi:hypothetical protein
MLLLATGRYPRRGPRELGWIGLLGLAGLAPLFMRNGRDTTLDRR